MIWFGQMDVVRGSLNNPVSLNRYLYVQNDPVGYKDPSGKYMVMENELGERLSLGQIQSGMAQYQKASEQQVVNSAQQAAKDNNATASSESARNGYTGKRLTFGEAVMQQIEERKNTDTIPSHQFMTFASCLPTGQNVAFLNRERTQDKLDEAQR